MLLKHLNFSIKNNELIGSIRNQDDEIELTDDDKYEFIDLVLNGKPEAFDPFGEVEPITYTKEQKEEWDKLYNELPQCLSIILQTNSFEAGLYKTRYNNINWIKTN